MQTIDDLIEAVELGEPQKVTAILEEEPTLLNETCSTGFAPIHAAIHQKRIEMVKLLIEAGADINSWGGNNETPLHLAAKSQTPEIVELLIASKADLDVGNSINKGALTPLLVAAMEAQYYKPEKSIEIIKLLINAGAFVDANTAVLIHDNARLKTLIEENPDLNILAALNREQLLSQAAQAKNEEAAKILLEQGREPTLNALYAAIESIDSFSNSHEQTTTGINILKMYLDAGGDHFLRSTDRFHSRSPHEYIADFDNENPEFKLLDLVNSFLDP